jgi:hypothetical protein
MKSEETQPNITGFWSWFADNHVEILEIMQGKRTGRVTEMIDEALAKNRLALTYEVTESVFGGELTFTPEGDAQVAVFIDRFVAFAPTLDGWVIFGRIQRKSLPTALAFVRALHGIDLSSTRFKVAWADDRIHLCFLDDALSALPEDQRYLVAGTFLDHALGESVSMEWVGAIDFKPSAEGIEMALMINEIIGELEGPRLGTTAA